MGKPKLDQLSRRERQIMDIIYRHGQAAAAEVQKELPDPPSYSAVRAMLRVLEEKGYVAHVQDGPRYLYSPTVARDKAKRSAIENLLQTFFEGSTTRAVATLLDMSRSELDEDDLARLEALVEQAKREGR